ncbi:MAG: amidohydrolase family protein [Acidimicrobiales bacterium]|jgi:5-methylthioadenosine/S-adenosylhomocysteine deaminase
MTDLPGRNEGDVDLVIEGGTVLPMGGRGPIADGAVAIDGGAIVAVGPAAELSSLRGRRRIDAAGGVIMPGFVNPHTHIGSNLLLRGLDEDVQLFEWLASMWRLKRNFDHETLYWASIVGLVEMVRSGITCFNEHFDAYAVDPEIEALDVVPLGATLAYGFADGGIYESITDWSWQTIAGFGDIVASHEGARDGRVRLALAPHATYSCSADMFRAVRRAADEVGVPIHVHLAEGRQEVAYVAEHYGTTPVQWLDSLGVLGPDVTAAHCTQLDGRDIEILAERGTRIATCPVCNAKLCSGTMPMREVRQAGITVGLATDGPASHNTLDMFQEMKFAGILHKQNVEDPRFLTTNELLELATTGAAAAMHRPELGRLAPGRPADVIVVDLGGAHVQPVYDVSAALVYSCRADDVRYTVVGGRVLFEDGAVNGVDEAEAVARFRQLALQLRDRSLG